MAADPAVRDQVLEMLAPLGAINSRSMFGGFGIFMEESMFALIAGSALFFKVDDSNRSQYEDVDSKPYGSMPYYRVPPEMMGNEDKLREWAQTSITIARATPKKKKR